MILPNPQFKCVFPTFDVFKTKFSTTSVSSYMDSPYMENFYKTIYDKYADRFLRWNYTSQILGNMTRYIKDTFFLFKNVQQLYEQSLSDLTAGNENFNLYNLPGVSDAGIASDTSRFLGGKQENKKTNSNLTNLDALKRVDEIEILMIKRFAKCFLPFSDIPEYVDLRCDIQMRKVK